MLEEVVGQDHPPRVNVQPHREAEIREEAITILWFASWLNDGGMHLGNAVFFVLLLSLITLLDDRFRPVHEARFAPARHAPGA